MIKTVYLNCEETCVKGLGGDNTIIVNRGTETVYASAAAGITPGANGVIAIGGGERDGLTDTNGTVYLKGSGEVNLRGTNENVNFRMPSLPDRGTSSAGGASSAGNGGATELMPVMSGITGYFTPEAINIGEGVWSNGITNAFNSITLQNASKEGNSVHFTTNANGSFESLAEPNVMYAIIKISAGDGSVITKGITSAYAYASFNLMGGSGELIYFASRGDNIPADITGHEYNVYCASRSGSTVHFFVNGNELPSTANADTGHYSKVMHLNYGVEPSCDFNLMMCAFGTEYHTPEEAKQNSLWLLDQMSGKWGA